MTPDQTDVYLHALRCRMPAADFVARATAEMKDQDFPLDLSTVERHLADVKASIANPDPE